jgi:hypothetical protein
MDMGKRGQREEGGRRSLHSSSSTHTLSVSVIVRLQEYKLWGGVGGGGGGCLVITHKLKVNK